MAPRPPDPLFVVPEARDYLLRTLRWETPLMKRVRERCEREGLPVVHPDTGPALRAFAALATRGRPARALEVGCLYGYSALCLLAGLPEGSRLDTIEMDDATANVAEAHFREAGVADRVTVRRGRALDVLPRLEGRYDLAFLDASKEEMVAYLDHFLQRAAPGAVVLADNLFWKGQAWDPAARDGDTLGVRGYTRRIVEDPRLVTTILPVGDGLGVSVLRA